MVVPVRCLMLGLSEILHMGSNWTLELRKFNCYFLRLLCLLCLFLLMALQFVSHTHVRLGLIMENLMRYPWAMENLTVTLLLLFWDMVSTRYLHIIYTFFHSCPPRKYFPYLKGISYKLQFVSQWGYLIHIISCWWHCNLYLIHMWDLAWLYTIWK